jgi:hypothetical protein
MAHWFTEDELLGYPVERAAVSGCDLSVLHIDGEWQWLVQRGGEDLAEGACCTEDDARMQAEAAALWVSNSPG